MRQQGFSAEEVAGAQSALIQTHLRSRTQDANLANDWVSDLYLGRSFSWGKGREDTVRALTPEQVNAAWRCAIDPAKLSVVLAVIKPKFSQVMLLNTMAPDSIVGLAILVTA